MTYYFAWGLKLSTTTYPAEIGIYRANLVNPFYNSFRFTYTPAIDTPLNLRLRVTLLLTSDPGSMALEGSISENLPQYDRNPVSCKLLSAPIRIECENVGTLTSDTIY